MKKSCPCVGCEVGAYYADVRAKAVEEKQITQTESCKCKKSVDGSYSLTLSGPSSEDGHRITFSQDIDIFDFFNLASEFFGVSVNLDYEERTNDCCG